MNKKNLRKQIIEERKLIPEADLHKWSEAITGKLFDTDFFNDAQSIFCYVSTECEPDTQQIIRRAHADGKTVMVPRTAQGGVMETVAIDSSVFEKAMSCWPRVYGIPEPPDSIPETNPDSIDLVIVPSIALDKDGYRLGYGGGYYDRFINSFMHTGSGKAKFALEATEQTKTQKRPFLVAIQYAEFLYEKSLPRESHDRQVDVLITDKGITIPPSSPLFSPA